jgi:hypothetical protein
MIRICESKRAYIKPDNSIVEAVAKIKIGFTAYLLSVPEYNKRKLKGPIPYVKEILRLISYLYNRRFAGVHGHFTMEKHKKCLKKQKLSS